MNRDIKEHRIAAAGIVLHEGRVLLVRYRNPDGKSFLVGPGGGVGSEEGLTHAIMREVKEETRIDVQPSKILFVEDLTSKRYRMVKIWFLCDVVGGTLTKTHEATQEGIVEVNWYSRDQLEDEVVYPPILKEIDWELFSKKTFVLQYLDFKKADI